MIGGSRIDGDLRHALSVARFWVEGACHRLERRATWRELMLMSDLRFPLLHGFIDITRARIIRDWYRGGATLCGVTGHAFAAWPEDMARIAGHENNGNQLLGDELCKVATEVLQEASFL
jgi:hypothetical protein